ncbi:MAG: hypothetical protein ACRDRN_13640 [Sciscionella sp.]
MAACLLAALITVAGCGTSQPQKVGMQKTITLEQARQRVNKYLDEAVSALPGHPTVIKNDPGAGADDMNCEDEHGQSLGTFQASSTERLGGLDSVSKQTVFAAMRKWWSANGFEVVSDNEQQPQHSSVLTRNRAGYGVTLEHNAQGAFYLSASSPCVWRNGTPEPTP